MNNWLPIVAALAGTALGGWIAYLNGAVQWRRQRSTEKNRVLLGKLEEACKTVVAIQLSIRKMYARAMTQLLTAQPQSFDEISDRIPIEDLNLLVSLYFEKLKPCVGSVAESRDKFGKLLAAVILTGSDNRRPAPVELTDAHSRVENACAQFLAEASLISRTYL